MYQHGESCTVVTIFSILFSMICSPFISIYIFVDNWHTLFTHCDGAWSCNTGNEVSIGGLNEPGLLLYSEPTLVEYNRHVRSAEMVEHSEIQLSVAITICEITHPISERYTYFCSVYSTILYDNRYSNNSLYNFELITRIISIGNMNIVVLVTISSYEIIFLSWSPNNMDKAWSTKLRWALRFQQICSEHSQNSSMRLAFNAQN